MPDRAHNVYRSGLSRNKALFSNKQLQDYVINKLINNRLTPKEISASLKVSGLKMRASAETIYQFIYSKHGLKLNLPSYLKFSLKKRGFRKSRKRKKPNITNLVSIHARPEAINERSEVGHWEGDLIIFSTTESKNITTMVERKTRFVKLKLNQNKTSNEVVGGIISSLGNHSNIYRSMTFDRGG